MAKNKADRQAAMAANQTNTDTSTDTTTQTQGDGGTANTEQPAPAGDGAAASTASPTTEAAPAAKGKSIVPAKYAGKYKDGGDSPTSKFIKEQCVGKEGFEFSAFFQLCRINGIAEDQVKRYENDIAEKKHGAQGRARMTLRNMLATIARKNGKLKAQDGSEVEVIEAKAPVTGAAAKAQEAAKPAEQPQEGASA